MYRPDETVLGMKGLILRGVMSKVEVIAVFIRKDRRNIFSENRMGAETSSGTHSFFLYRIFLRLI